MNILPILICLFAGFAGNVITQERDVDSGKKKYTYNQVNNTTRVDGKPVTLCRELYYCDVKFSAEFMGTHTKPTGVAEEKFGLQMIVKMQVSDLLVTADHPYPQLEIVAENKTTRVGEGTYEFDNPMHTASYFLNAETVESIIRSEKSGFRLIWNDDSKPLAINTNLQLQAARIFSFLSDIREGNVEVGGKEVKEEQIFSPGADVSVPKLIHRVDPVFPPRARNAGIHGFILMDAVIDKEGRVCEITILEAPPASWGFNKAAKDAVSQWLFEPSMFKGKPVKVQIRFSLEFEVR